MLAKNIFVVLNKIKILLIYWRSVFLNRVESEMYIFCKKKFLREDWPADLGTIL